MKRIALVLLAACSSSPKPAPVEPPAPVAPPAPKTSMDDKFKAFADKWLADELALSPVDATQAGEHRYDDKWPDLTPAGDAALHDFLAKTQIPKEGLNEQNAIDAQLMADQIAFTLWSLDVEKPRDHQPMYYTDLIGTGFDPLVNRNFGTPASRLASVLGRLDGIPAVVAAAKGRLSHPAKINTETAIQQCEGLIELVEKELAARFPDGKDQLAQHGKPAADALKDFLAYLKKDLLAKSDGSFRLGREQFAKKLAFVLEDDVDIEAIAAGARKLLADTQEAMVDTAKQIWTDDKLGKLPPLTTPEQRKAFVKKTLDHVALEHPTNKTIVADSKAWLEKATKFVRDNDLVRVPDEPVKVDEMPEYRRGVAVAYCDSSGPLEQTPETLFAISPTPSDWPKARVDSFYREYNQSMLADLAIHEAMPGHYLQLMHNNQGASKLRAVFGSGAFVEGWAVYSEWLMAEHGFGGAKVKLERQKMAVRVAANTILDHDIHAGEMDEKAALAFLKGEAFQEDGEAVGKWKRARLSSAQLTTYYYGFSQWLELRHANEGKPGFKERAWHDKALSFGSPAMKFIRQLMK